MDFPLARQIILGIQVIVGLIGLYRWQTIKNSYWRYFPFYLFILAFFSSLSHFIPNQIAYKISRFLIIPYEYLFIFLIYSKHNKNKQEFWINYGIFMVFFIVELILIQDPKKYYFSSISYTVGNLLLLILIVRYFYKLTNSDTILLFYRERMFWVSVGFFVYYLGTFPYYGLFNFMLKTNMDLLRAYTWIQLSLDASMYLFLAIGFLWSKEN